MQDAPPLIVTAALDDASFARFDALRQAHFPPRDYRLPAHLTLFHALPGSEEAAVVRTLEAACARRGPIPLEVRSPFSLGRGVAYRLASPELERLRAEAAEAFSPWLTAQDRQGFRPHVTVQNKVEPTQARALLERLEREFEPFSAAAEGLLVWRYLDGPWEAVTRLPFAPS